jgi:hypothetical protein
VKRTAEYLREVIQAWLQTASESELMQVFDLIQVLLLRRRYRDDRSSRPPEPEENQG